METSLISATLAQIEAVPPLGAPERNAAAEVQWYAAYTIANHEKRVAQQLTWRSVEHFLPVYESVRRWKDRRVRLRLPLFPGYVFVRLALRDRLRVLAVPGVARLVGFDGCPTVVPAEDIEAIRACLEGNRDVQPHPYVVAAHKMWWRFGFDVLFAALLVEFAWALVPKRGALGLAAAYGFAYACTSLVFFLFHQQGSWNGSPSQRSQRQRAAKVTGKLMSEL